MGEVLRFRYAKDEEVEEVVNEKVVNQKEEKEEKNQTTQEFKEEKRVKNANVTSNVIVHLYKWTIGAILLATFASSLLSLIRVWIG